jgi:regulation of enolase protein 1 (concanavalin A-like superfamily)
VTYDSLPPAVSISAPSVSTTTFGPVTYTVTYTDANFSASTLAAGDITVNKTGTADGTVSVTGTGTTRTVTISTTSGEGTLGLSIAAGTATDIVGNSAAAAGPSATFTVSKADQTITFGPLAAQTYGNSPFTLSATASSGLPVSYASSNPAVATVSGNTVTIIGAGTTTITASQAGNENYNAAPSVPQTQTVNQASQTITFAALPAKAVGDAPFTLGATASSGLPVSYTSSDPAVATVSGDTVTIVAAGTTTITASQAGNTNYAPAPDVAQPFTVNGALPPPWVQADIGAPGAVGTATYSGGVYTVAGAGTIGAKADTFHFVYQTLSADGQIVARIPSFENTGTGARIGVMIRDTLATGSKSTLLAVNGSGAYKWMRRTSTGGNTTSTNSSTGTAPNVWVRLTRAGSTITASKSTNGTTWTTIGSTTVTMATNCYFGLVVASDTAALNTSTFDNVTVVP